MDTGASATIDNDRSRFISLDLVENVQLNGIGSGLPVVGIGTIKWSVLSRDGYTVDIFIKDVLYVPDAPMCLLRPQQLARQTGKEGDGFNALGALGILQVDGHTFEIPYNASNNLPIFTANAGATKALRALNAEFNELNLSKKQRKLLHTHQRLSHMSFDRIQQLAREGALPKDIANCEHPICPACQTGKGHRRAVVQRELAPIDAGDI